VDVLRAQAAIQGAERRLNGARQVREQALSSLRTDMALEDGDFRVEWPEIPLPPLDDEDRLVARALDVRPEVDAAQQAVELARLEVERRKGERRPTVQAEGTLTQQRGNFPTERFGSIGVGFSLPLYQGGQAIARRTVAELRLEQARLGLREVELNVREAVRLLLVDLRTANTTLSLSSEILLTTEAEYEQIYDLYEALESTSLDVATAELSLVDARRALASATLARDLAEVRVFFATGELRSAFLSSILENQ
jgi:outer membrane protein